MGPNQEATAHRASQNPRILLVENDANAGKGLQTVLREEGYAVELATTGSSALESFRGNGFDLVVADLRLPDIDGMDVLKQISNERPETKMLVITEHPSISSAVAAVKIGVIDYLRKPFTDDEFKAAVASALKSSQGASMENLLVETHQGRLRKLSNSGTS